MSYEITEQDIQGILEGIVTATYERLNNGGEMNCRAVEALDDTIQHVEALLARQGLANAPANVNNFFRSRDFNEILQTIPERYENFAELQTAEHINPILIELHHQLGDMARGEVSRCFNENSSPDEPNLEFAPVDPSMPLS